MGAVSLGWLFPSKIFFFFFLMYVRYTWGKKKVASDWNTRVCRWLLEILPNQVESDQKRQTGLEGISRLTLSLHWAFLGSPTLHQTLVLAWAIQGAPVLKPRTVFLTQLGCFNVALQIINYHHQIIIALVLSVKGHFHECNCDNLLRSDMIHVQYIPEEVLSSDPEASSILTSTIIMKLFIKDESRTTRKSFYTLDIRNLGVQY